MTTKVVLQPCGEGSPAKHYADTVEMFVPLARMEPFLTRQEMAELHTKFPSGRAAAWGVTTGEKSVNEKKWQRLEPGDIALFAKGGRIVSAGTIAMKIHNRPLAVELWKEEQGATWEYMYFLQGIQRLNIPYREFNVAAGYKANYVIQGFNVLTEAKSSAVLQRLNIGILETPIEKILIEIQNVIAAEGEFDPESEGEGRNRVMSSICRRRGQPEFRRKLVEAYAGRCAISGCDAVQTLEAAHIMPYNGRDTNHPANGLLLRADLHVLFDLGLIAVDPSTLTVVVADALRTTTYGEFEGKPLTIPFEPTLRPNVEALKKHKATSSL
jgi:HNH endonuclease